MNELSHPKHKIECVRLLPGESIASYYIMLDKLGEGSFGVVNQGICRKTGQQVAIKITKQPESAGFSIDIIREINILQNISHDNVIKILKMFCCVETCQTFLVYEYCDYDLHDLIKHFKDIKLTLEQQPQPQSDTPLSPIMPLVSIKTLMYQLLSALACLHDNQVIHRDVKPGNILIQDLVYRCRHGFSQTQTKIANVGEISVNPVRSSNNLINEPESTKTTLPLTSTNNTDNCSIMASNNLCRCQQPNCLCLNVTPSTTTGSDSSDLLNHIKMLSLPAVQLIEMSAYGSSNKHNYNNNNNNNSSNVILPSSHRANHQHNSTLQHGSSKLCDFGLSRDCSCPMRELGKDGTVVTVWYRAPELLLHSLHYTYAIDVWAAGCILAELVHLKPLFLGIEQQSGFQESQFRAICSVLGAPTPSNAGTLTELPLYNTVLRSLMGAGHATRDVLSGMLDQYINDNGVCEDLLRKMLCFDPDQRISASDALKHEFFHEILDHTHNIFRLDTVPRTNDNKNNNTHINDANHTETPYVHQGSVDIVYNIRKKHKRTLDRQRKRKYDAIGDNSNNNQTRNMNNSTHHTNNMNRSSVNSGSNVSL